MELWCLLGSMICLSYDVNDMALYSLWHIKFFCIVGNCFSKKWKYVAWHLVQGKNVHCSDTMPLLHFLCLFLLWVIFRRIGQTDQQTSVFLELLISFASFSFILNLCPLYIFITAAYFICLLVSLYWIIYRKVVLMIAPGD